MDNISRKIANTISFWLVAGCALLLIPVMAEAVTVGPAKIEATADPGDTVRGEMFLKNDGDSADTFYPKVQKFTEKGTKKQFLDQETLLSNWMNLPESIDLAAGEEERFPYSIDIPDDAPPGGHFGVVWWSTVPPESMQGTSSKQVSITTRAGILTYLNVTGDTSQSASITDFSPSAQLTGSLPVDFSMTVENTGTTYISPEGSIKVSSLLGNTRAELDANPRDLQILPEGSKTFKSTLKGDSWYWGPYKAKATVYYGDEENGQQVMKDSARIWVMPPVATTIGAVILLVLFVGIPFGLKRYRQYIEKQIKEEG